MRAAGNLLSVNRARWVLAQRLQARASSTSSPVAPPLRLRMFDEKNTETLSKEYIEKNWGYLKDAKNKPVAGQSIATGAYNSPAFLQAVAEINGTEFNVGKLDAKQLKAKYQEQLSNFEAVRRPALEKEGQPALVIDQLREIYTLRANVSLWEVERAVAELGFLDGRNDLRATKRALESHPVWKVLGMLAPTDTTYFHKETATKPKRNAELAAQNVRIFRGARGLANSLEKGLTEEQYGGLFKALEAKVVSASRAEELLAKVQEFRSSLPKKALSRTETKQLVKPFLAQFSPAEREYLLKLGAGSQKEVALTTITSLPASYDPEDFKDKVVELSKKLRSQNPSLAPKLTRLEQAVQYLVKPDVQRKLRLLDLLGRVELTADEKEAILAPFSDKTFDDALLNDVLNPHPIAERLWGDRMAWIAADNVDYSKKYEDNDGTHLYSEFSDLPQKRQDKLTKSAVWNAPILGPYPFNSGIEEITHWKLQQLAERWLGFDLTTDLGVAQFDSFVHNYQVSPGEETLDRLFPCPPPAHTYDELPIIKFDGWDEADVPEDYPEYVAQQQAAVKGAAKPVH